MPHCTIEYTNADQKTVTKMIEVVMESCVASQLFNRSDIKVRAVKLDHYLAGNQGQDFIHISNRILAGRTQAQKDKLAGFMLQNIKEQISLANCSLTIEVIDINKPSFQKHDF